MADRRELTADLSTVLLEAMAGHQAGLWTALPAIVQSYDADAGTVEAYSALRFQRRLENGTYEWMDPPPLFVDCPVVFPGGGGFTLTFPVKPGDEVLMVFASRCIDAWWDMSGVQVQTELRMHDMSDGFAIVGPRSRPRALAAASTTGVELRADGRDAFIRIDEAGDISITTSGNISATAGGDAVVGASGSVEVTAGASIALDAPVINVTGAINMTGVVTIVGSLIVNGKDLGEAHTHDHGTMTATGHTGVVL